RRRRRLRSRPAAGSRHRGARPRHPHDARACARPERLAGDRLGGGPRHAGQRGDPAGGGARMKKIRVLLADDHAILRAGLRMLLEAQPDMAVVAEAADGREAIVRAGDSQPDVAVVDLTMPGLSGVETLEGLRREVPATRLLVLTMHDDPGYARLALAAGASGHVIKDAESSELLAAIRAVHRGRTFVQVGSDPGPRPRAGPPAGADAQPSRASGARAARARPHQPRSGRPPL